MLNTPIFRYMAKHKVLLVLQSFQVLIKRFSIYTNSEFDNPVFNVFNGSLLVPQNRILKMGVNPSILT